MGTINRYSNLGVENEWIQGFLANGDEFWQNQTLGTVMLKNLKRFLCDAGMTTGKNQALTAFGHKAIELGVESEKMWGIAICNLAYTSAFNWWIRNIELYVQYSNEELKELIRTTRNEETENSVDHSVKSFKNIFYTNKVLGETIGLGVTDVTEIVTEKKKTRNLNSVTRHAWYTPIPEVILYALYKFAEKCDYYQFTLSYLMDESIEREGISPTTIFGLDRETMIRLLNGLAMNYPDYISASFVMSLETITLQRDRHAEDILQLL